MSRAPKSSCGRALLTHPKRGPGGPRHIAELALALCRPGGLHYWVFAIALTVPALAQDARQIIEESQRRGRATSQRYDGVLETIAADGKVTRKSWQSLRM